MKVLSIFGTRPEAIKMAPVVKELEKYKGSFESVVCVTGQHREMLDQVNFIFGIEPQIDLDLMEPDQSLESLTAKVIKKISEVLSRVDPDLVLVQGDTTTAMASALAAFYQKIPVGHIEAGLRTYDPYNPFPEEINRQLISVIADYHFAPTQTAFDALLNEHVPEENIYLTGNTVVDALHKVVEGPCKLDFEFLSEIDKLLLITAHRRENFGKPLKDICLALKEIVRRFPEVGIVYPVHLNPNVKNVVYELLAGEDRIFLVEPLGYIKFAHLMKSAYLVLTDSGGIQEEAPILGKPVLLLRKETERPEGIKAGCVKIVGTDVENIIDKTAELLNSEEAYSKMSEVTELYGDGHAAERIVEIILEKNNLR